ncbi:MAG: ComF family protein [Alphaproteobacteria bacterium]
MVHTMRLTRSFDKLGRTLVGLLLPPHCPVCEAVLPLSEPMNLCPVCYGRLPWWDKTGVLPPQLPKAIDTFDAPCVYEGMVRDAILRMKFQDTPALAGVLAKLLLPVIPSNATVLVPVPMHGRALRGRLYNQAALLAQAVGKLKGIPADVTALVRINPSDGQARRTRAQRLKLSSTDFVAHPRLADQHVVLVDDIYTTGATAKACALALRKAGVASVHVRTLAYTSEK